MIHDSAITTYKNPELAPWALGSSLTNVVYTDDPRLFDAREPLPHEHDQGDIEGLEESLSSLFTNLSTKQPRGEYHITMAMPGTQGPQGPQGPPGDSTAAFSGEWVWTTKTTDAGTSGQVGNNASGWAATQININEQKGDNTDVTPYLSRAVVGDRLYIRQKTDSARYGEYEITAPGTDNGTWWSFPVTLLQSGGSVPNGNAPTIVTHLSNTVTAPTGAGDDTLTWMNL